MSEGIIMRGTKVYKDWQSLVNELENENQRLREAHESNVKEFAFFAEQDAPDTDWQIVCGYMADRSKAALLEEKK